LHKPPSLLVVDQVNAEGHLLAFPVNIGYVELLLALDISAPGKLGKIDAEPVQESLGVMPSEVLLMGAAFWQPMDKGTLLLFRVLRLFPAVQGVTREPRHLHRQPERVASLPGEASGGPAHLNRRLGLQESLDDLGQARPQGEQYREDHLASLARDITLAGEVFSRISRKCGGDLRNLDGSFKPVQACDD
jgi:hypothetical protein